jgi:hypothetical protein
MEEALKALSFSSLSFSFFDSFPLITRGIRQKRAIFRVVGSVPKVVPVLVSVHVLVVVAVAPGCTAPAILVA